ncbi:ADA HAT complex component 1 [Cladophialophora yegresii CBS 114405]|uniref:ADA HAT complex component 1 n=1 Tax=Cladophialophora yegresii CBS 114405 TaxID=1182544 RepID=W9W130_9EURO|nr:ADA HAT complex component 1 [Cladophialophora yegresii CBS 114405]EXJ58680.1 ADA HAT complex component 1 [Cladophialophora yegresii CBS 114405]
MRMFVSKQDSPGSGSLAMPVAGHKRRQSGDPQGQADRKRARTVERQQNATLPALANGTLTADLAPGISKTTASTTDNPSSYLPSPPEAKMDESELRAIDSAVNGAESDRLESIRNVIQTQISLEILLKHKELRLIDQEMAKCQAALEQLRRCHEIPFPGTQGLSSAVSNGTGPALRTSFSTPLPQSPAPWGALEGPYTRHYAKWLLQDPRFEGGEVEQVVSTPVGKSPMKFRSQTRGSFAETPQTSSQSRTQRGGKLKSLPPGYGQPKEKATGPMIIKRKSDGATVKLVCPDCGRSDFGSAQGFINHCRIGHGRSFASHDAAADACGEPVEVDESGAMIGVEPVLTPTAGNVHPLIRSAKLLQPTPPRTASQTTIRNTKSETAKAKVSPEFKASTLTPNLSDLVKGRGLGIDLQELVSDAKTKVELPESDSEDDDMDIDVPMQNTPQGRHPQVAGSKQPPKPTITPLSSPLVSSSMLRSTANLRGGGVQHFAGAIGAIGASTQPRPRGMTLPISDNSPTDLRPSDPSPTSESNQAPSLVDDDEEFEPHSPSSSSISDEHDIGEIDFEVQGDEDDARSVLQGPEFQPTCTQAARPSHARRPSAIRRHGEDREEKHVSFVSPSPARDTPQPRVSAGVSGDCRKRKV